MANTFCHVGAYAVLMTMSPSPLGAETPDTGAIRGYLNLKPTASAGVLRAGLLCLPSGTAQVADFVSSEIDFQRVLDNVASALAASKSSRFSPIRSVRLTGLNAKLCARSYGVFGMGDKVSHSGTVQVTFEIETGGNGDRPTVDSRSIKLEIEKKDALPLRSILELALQELLDPKNP
jgi:hypothetical protein